jgi:hypothetical protein
VGQAQGSAGRQNQADSNESDREFRDRTHTLQANPSTRVPLFFIPELPCE